MGGEESCWSPPRKAKARRQMLEECLRKVILASRGCVRLSPRNVHAKGPPKLEECSKDVNLVGGSV